MSGRRLISRSKKVVGCVVEKMRSHGDDDKGQTYARFTVYHCFFIAEFDSKSQQHLPFFSCEMSAMPCWPSVISISSTNFARSNRVFSEQFKTPKVRVHWNFRDWQSLSC